MASLAERGYTLSPEERDRTVGILRAHLLDVVDTDGDGASSSRYSSIGVLPQFARSQGEVGGMSLAENTQRQPSIEERSKAS